MLTWLGNMYVGLAEVKCVAYIPTSVCMICLQTIGAAGGSKRGHLPYMVTRFEVYHRALTFCFLWDIVKAFFLPRSPYPAYGTWGLINTVNVGLTNYMFYLYAKRTKCLNGHRRKIYTTTQSK